MPNLTPAADPAPDYTGVPAAPDLTARKIATREERITQLTTIVTELDAEIRDRKNDIARLDEQLGERQRKLDDSDSVFKQLQATYDAKENELKVKIYHTRQELEPLEIELSQRRTELKQAQRNIPILEKQYAAHEKVLIHELNNLTTRIKHESNELYGKIAALQQDHRILNAQTAGLVKQYETAEQALVALQQANAKEVAAHKAEIAKYTEIIDDLLARQVEARKINNANQQAANAELATTTAHTTEQVNKLIAKEAIVDRKLERLRYLEELEELQQKGRLAPGALRPAPLQRAQLT